jgi:hypothetical protein
MCLNDRVYCITVSGRGSWAEINIAILTAALLRLGS